MGSINDQVWVNVTSHSHCQDGTTRNDWFTYTTTLANYTTDVASNMATPLYNQVAAERTNPGGLATPIYGGSTITYAAAGASTVCDLKLELGIGQQALATPLRYHLVGQSMLSDNAINGAGDVYTWITTLIRGLAPVDIYPGSVNLI